ncbi:GAF domain-containing protein [Ideonella sp.]|uniref:GAF domain-containing protein n=1 Tax=Ideonella sp. TaxID=1929293 RepID=UPI0035AFD84A
MSPDHLSASYRDVDRSDALHARRASAPMDTTAHLLALTQRIAEQPDQALQALIDVAMRATAAHASGLSLVTAGPDGHEVFRWVATAGDLAGQLGATMPRHFSPCGDVLRRNALTWMVQPARHYGVADDLGVSLEEVLLAPFAFDGRPQGTLWVTSRDASKTFTREDGDVLEELAAFVGHSSALVQRLGTRRFS